MQPLVPLIILATILVGTVTLQPNGAIASSESAQVATGKVLYDQYCQTCHGKDGKRGEGFQTPIWGEGALIGPKFGNAQALVDFMQIMPFNDPTLMNDQQKLAVVAYLLANHGAIPRTDEVTIGNLGAIAIK